MTDHPDWETLSPAERHALRFGVVQPPEVLEAEIEAGRLRMARDREEAERLEAEREAAIDALVSERQGGQSKKAEPEPAPTADQVTPDTPLRLQTLRALHTRTAR